MGCENGRHLTVVGLHDTGPRCVTASINHLTVSQSSRLWVQPPVDDYEFDKGAAATDDGDDNEHIDRNASENDDRDDGNGEVDKGKDNNDHKGR